MTTRSRICEVPSAIYTILTSDLKVYGGKSIDPKSRLAAHQKTWPGCSMVISHWVPAGEEWKPHEVAHIAMLRRNFKYVLNKNEGGGGPSSTESRRRLSESMSSRVVSQQTRDKISAANRMRTHSPETKAKMSLSHMGHSVSDETRVKLGNGFRGRSHTAETKARISATKRGI